MQREELTETLSKPIFKNGVFSNPWSTWSDTKFSNVLKWALFTKNNTNLPSDKKVKNLKALKKLKITNK